MAKEIKKDDPPTVQAATPVYDDLSDTIENTIEKQLNEEVKIVRVFGDHYRCNWWVRDRPANWLSSTTGKISKSRFLTVTKAADGELIIKGMERKR